MSELDVRSEKRYSIATPVTFWWPGQDGSVQSGKGLTRDISNRGVLVAATQCPPKGTLVQLTIFLSKMRESGHALTLQGEGVVIRVENCSEIQAGPEEPLFAAFVQFYPERRRILEHINKKNIQTTI